MVDYTPNPVLHQACLLERWGGEIPESSDEPILSNICVNFTPDRQLGHQLLILVAVTYSLTSIIGVGM